MTRPWLAARAWDIVAKPFEKRQLTAPVQAEKLKSYVAAGTPARLVRVNPEYVCTLLAATEWLAVSGDHAASSAVTVIVAEPTVSGPCNALA